MTTTNGDKQATEPITKIFASVPIDLLAFFLVIGSVAFLAFTFLDSTYETAIVQEKDRLGRTMLDPEEYRLFLSLDGKIREVEVSAAEYMSVTTGDRICLEVIKTPTKRIIDSQLVNNSSCTD